MAVASLCRVPQRSAKLGNVFAKPSKRREKSSSKHEPIGPFAGMQPGMATMPSLISRRTNVSFRGASQYSWFGYSSLMKQC